MWFYPENAPRRCSLRRNSVSPTKALFLGHWSKPTETNRLPSFLQVFFPFDTKIPVKNRHERSSCHYHKTKTVWSSMRLIFILLLMGLCATTRAVPSDLPPKCEGETGKSCNFISHNRVKDQNTFFRYRTHYWWRPKYVEGMVGMRHRLRIRTKGKWKKKQMFRNHSCLNCNHVLYGYVVKRR